MVSFFLLLSVMLVGSCIAYIHNDGKLNPSHHLNRIYRHNEYQRKLRNIMGKIFDTDTNTIYSIEGQKQQATASLASGLYNKNLEDLACLTACYTCVEDYPVTTRKKKAADNCGPMCDCADSCSHTSIEQIDKTYGQSSATRGDKTCFLRTYTQSLNNETPSLQ